MGDQANEEVPEANAPSEPLLPPESPPAGEQLEGAQGEGGQVEAAPVEVVAQAEVEAPVEAPVEDPVEVIPPPRQLHVSGTESDGTYWLLDDLHPNGFPAWKWDDGESWLYSGNDGKWYVGDEDEYDLEFDCASGHNCSADFHNGRWPNMLTAEDDWRRLDPTSKRYKTDYHIKIVDPASIVEEEEEEVEEIIENIRYDENTRKEVPTFLYVSGTTKYDGCYELVPGFNSTRMPMWRRHEDTNWIFSGRSYRWILGDEEASFKDFRTDAGIFRTTDKHGGALPPDLSSDSWQFFNDMAPEPVWEACSSLRVTLMQGREEKTEPVFQRACSDLAHRATLYDDDQELADQAKAAAKLAKQQKGRKRQASAWAVDMIGGAHGPGGVTNQNSESAPGKTKFALGDRDFKVAEDHFNNTSAGVYRTGDGKEAEYVRRSYFGTKLEDFKDFGLGIQLHFSLLKDLGMLMAIPFVITVGFAVLNYTGDGLAYAIEASGTEPGTTPHMLAKFSAANIGEWPVNVTDAQKRYLEGDQPIQRMTFLASFFDFIAAMIILLWLLHYRDNYIPRLISDQQDNVASADDWAIFVDCVPRRLPGDDHHKYAEHLKNHFEDILLAKVNLDNAPPGLKVVSSASETRKRTTRHQSAYQSSATAAALKKSRTSAFHEMEGVSGEFAHGKRHAMGTYHGRVGNGTASVQWKDKYSQAKPMPEMVQASDIRDVALLKRLHEDNLDPETHVPGEKLIVSIDLVYDFNGLLGKYKDAHTLKSDMIAAEVRKKRKKGEQVEMNVIQRDVEDTMAEKIKTVLDEVDRPVQEHDVIGAFIIFTHSEHRRFMLKEYRFSRTILRRFQRSGLKFFWHNIRVWEAPPPSDIIWVNMDFNFYKRCVRTCLLMGLLGLIISSVVAVLSYSKTLAQRSAPTVTSSQCAETAVSQNMTTPIQYLNLTTEDCGCILIGVGGVYNDNPVGAKDQCQEWLDKKIELDSIRFGAAGIGAIVGVLIGPLNQMLSNFNRPVSTSEMNRNVMFMTTVFQIVNLGVILLIVNADFIIPNGILGDGNPGIFGLFGAGDYRYVSGAWYITVGGVLVLTMITNSFSVPLAGVAQAPLFYIKRWFCTKRATLRRDLIEYNTQAEFPLAVRAAQNLSACFVCIAYSAALPPMWTCAWFTSALFYLIDKFSFIYGSKRPPRYGKDMTLLYLNWMQFAILLHGGIGLFAYGEPGSVPSWSVAEYNEKADDYAWTTDQEAMEGKFVWLQPFFTLKDAILTRAQVASAFPQFMTVLVMAFIYTSRFLAFTVGSSIASGASLVADATAPKLTSKVTKKYHEVFLTKREKKRKQLKAEYEKRCDPENAELYEEDADTWYAREGVLMIDEPFNKKPLKALRRNNLAGNYNVLKVQEFKFMDALNRRWLESWRAKRNVSWGLNPDGSEFMQDRKKKPDPVMDAAYEQMLADEVNAAREKLGMSGTSTARKSAGSFTAPRKKKSRASAAAAEATAADALLVDPTPLVPSEAAPKADVEAQATAVPTGESTEQNKSTEPEKKIAMKSDPKRKSSRPKSTKRQGSNDYTPLPENDVEASA